MKSRKRLKVKIVKVISPKKIIARFALSKKYIKTNEEILRAAVKKAEKEGYPAHWGHPMFNLKGDMVASNYNVIFSHKFAKAFWGEKVVCRHGYNLCDGCDTGLLDKQKNPITDNELYAWQFHLKEMVVEQEPLKYLESFL